MRTRSRSVLFLPPSCGGTSPACHWSTGGTVLRLSAQFRGQSSASNAVGVHEDLVARPSFLLFLLSLVIAPVKHAPLSDSMVADVANGPMAYHRVLTAFSEVAPSKSRAATTHLETSFRYVIRPSLLSMGCFMTCQSVCHIALMYLHS